MNFVTDIPVSPVDVESGKKKGKDDSQLGYQHTLMYGRYTTDLSHYAREETRRLKLLERKRKREEKLRRKEYRAQYRSHYYSLLSKGFSYVWKNTFAKFGEDWTFLAMLGILMAIISFCMDWGIGVCNKARIWLFTDLDYCIYSQYIAWIILPILLVWFSAGFVHLIAPQAIGSGIPEMKTILRGVTLKEYLTFKTLFAKVIGLTASLGSGLPLGKEGPFVHIASMVATLLSKLQSFHGIYENESRSVEMLAAASAVGVACCFAAPIGGVLFSIEVTAVYFAVRNYWRGFFAAAFGALFFRLLAVWFQGHDTIKPVFQTVLGSQFPFDPLELIVFSLIGVASGLLGALFVLLHRKYVLWMRGNKRLNAFLQKNRFIYPFLITWFVMSANFPLGFGQFIAGHLTTHDQVVTLFSNFSWCLDNFTVEQITIVDHWKSPYTGIFTNLTLFIISTFFLSIIASTIPVPSGNFVPVFKMGAGLGRLFGEAMYLWFPQGVTFSGDKWPVVPGGYAVVGAAAVSGAVTRTISIAVIVSEMTGQITYIVPVVVAVLIANAVAGLLQPSLFDSISMIKKLPYLPDFIPSSSAGAYNVTVNDFMIRDVIYIWYGMTYKELKGVLKSHKHLGSFPLVETPDNMILIGSIQRVHLIKAVERHIGRERRIQAAAKWHNEVLERERELERKRHEAQAPTAPPSRRPSRFEVVPVPTIVTQNTESLRSIPKENGHGSTCGLGPNGDTLPRKSILKKTNSFSLHNFGQYPSPFQANYMTVTGAENRLKNAFHLIFQKSGQLQDASPDGEGPSEDSTKDTMTSSHSQTPTTTSQYKKTVQLPRERIIDMSPEEQELWEEEELNRPVNFARCHIDPAPFQLVAKTTLLKVHSLFSLLGITLAYVTATGKLIGVVAMKELRKAIETCNAGTFVPNEAQIVLDTESTIEDGIDGEPTSPNDYEASISSRDELDNTTIDTEPEMETDLTDDESVRLRLS